MVSNPLLEIETKLNDVISKLPEREHERVKKAFREWLPAMQEKNPTATTLQLIKYYEDNAIIPYLPIAERIHEFASKVCLEKYIDARILLEKAAKEASKSGQDQLTAIDYYYKNSLHRKIPWRDVLNEDLRARNAIESAYLSPEFIQKELIILGEGPVYIGAMALQKSKNYGKKQEFGCIDEDFLNSIKEKPEESILYPEKYIDGAAWTPKLNQAFMEGAILSGRKIVLVTNPNFYGNNGLDREKWMRGNWLKNGTLYELLALQRYEYAFEGMDNNKTIFRQTIEIKYVDLSDLFDTYEKVVTSTMDCNVAYQKYERDINNLFEMFSMFFPKIEKTSDEWPFKSDRPGLK